MKALNPKSAHKHDTPNTISKQEFTTRGKKPAHALNPPIGTVRNKIPQMNWRETHYNDETNRGMKRRRISKTQSDFKNNKTNLDRNDATLTHKVNKQQTNHANIETNANPTCYSRKSLQHQCRKMQPIHKYNI